GAALGVACLDRAGGGGARGAAPIEGGRPPRGDGAASRRSGARPKGSGARTGALDRGAPSVAANPASVARARACGAGARAGARGRSTGHVLRVSIASTGRPSPAGFLSDEPPAGARLTLPPSMQCRLPRNSPDLGGHPPPGP